MAGSRGKGKRRIEARMGHICQAECDVREVEINRLGRVGLPYRGKVSRLTLVRDRQAIWVWV